MPPTATAAAAVQEEIDALEAIFKPEEFQYCPDSSSGSLTYRYNCDIECTLRFQLPKTYPTSSPPELVSLHSLEISEPDLERASAELLQTYRKGEPVLFDWHQCLVACVDELLSQEVECRVCLETRKRSEFQLVGTCSHIFCRDCLSAYAKCQVNGLSMAAMACPEERCAESLAFHTVKRALPPALFERYDLRLLEKFILSIPDMVWCPRRECQYPAHSWPREGLGVCPSCSLAFCLRCERTYHGVNPCSQKHHEQRKLALAEQHPGGQAAADLHTLEQILLKKGVRFALEFLYDLVDLLFFSHPEDYKIAVMGSRLPRKGPKRRVHRREQCEFFGEPLFNFIADNSFSHRALRNYMNQLADAAHVSVDPESTKDLVLAKDRYRLCPMCKVPIEKEYGCCRMYCVLDQEVFCWYCMQDYSTCNNGGYCGRSRW